MKRILLKIIILFVIILPLYLFWGANRTYAYDCGRCSDTYKHAYAQWNLEGYPDCETAAQSGMVTVTYTCNCSCCIFCTNYWNTSCHDACCTTCTPPACSTLGSYWTSTPCSGTGCSTATTQCNNVDSCWDYKPYTYRDCYKYCTGCSCTPPSCSGTSYPLTSCPWAGCSSTQYSCLNRDSCNQLCGGSTYRTCWKCTPTSCTGCTPSCPSGQSTTYSGPLCEANSSSCTGNNSCGSSCTRYGDTCYYDETNTPPASPPASVTLNVNTESYTLSTDSGNPTNIKYPPAGATVTVEAPSDAGVDGYKFVADNYGVDSQWAGGTECQGVDGEDFCTEGASNTQTFDPYTKTAAEVLLENAEGEISAYYYTENDCDSDKEYSSAITGYYTVMPIPTSSYYEIEVNTALDFTGTVMWDSGKTSMTTIEAAERTEDLIYNGTTLSWGETYYWRIKFWDNEDIESDWSEVANFTTNSTPTVPTNLLTEGETNPTGLATGTPYFSAIYNDPNTGDTADFYRIEVNTSSDFTGTTMWDSTKSAMSVTSEGTRSPNITYAGSALTQNTGVTYYWRIKFWDTAGAEGEWSSAANFTMNEPPTAPTDLLTEGQTNPTKITATAPTFSAIYNDPDTGDTSSYYQIQVNTSSGFDGTTMWDSTKSAMTTTNEGDRSPNITYAGSALTQNTGVTYYWRIKFWDANDAGGSWSSTANFTMNAPPTAPTGLLTQGQTNPTGVDNTSPNFSAIFNDPDTLDSSSYYRLQVNTTSGFDGTTMWDSTKSAMNATSQGHRSPDIEYDGSALDMFSTIYYWRIMFWDANDAQSPWSETATFQTAPPTTNLDGNLNLNGINID